MDGKAVILAGGSGGLGAAVAELVASRGGIPVIGCHRNRERAKALALQLKQRYGLKAPVVTGNILQAWVRKKLIEAAARAGELYGLVPLVGSPARVPIEMATEDDLLESTSINFAAPLLMARDFAAAAGERDASIVFVSTMQAIVPFAGSTVYAAPKAALVHASRILAKQWGGPRRIRVNTVAPGVTGSGMALESIRKGKYDPFIEKQIITRFGQPGDIAKAIVFFLEPDNYVTGQILTVDGGLTLRM